MHSSIKSAIKFLVVPLMMPHQIQLKERMHPHLLVKTAALVSFVLNFPPFYVRFRLLSIVLHLKPFVL